ncbi:hypothetical protein ISCGN_020882 [Ixodes scapularis]
MTLSDKGDILESHCECPRGAAKCSHTVATALYAALNGLSKTDLPQQWLHAAAGRSLRAVSEADLQVFCSTLEPCATKWVIQRASPDSSHPPPPAEKFSVAIVLASGEDFQITDEDKNTIQEVTVGQSKNASWSLFRKYRLTASNFGLVLYSCRRNTYPPSLFKKLFGEYDLSTSSAIIWVQVHEADALKEYEEETGSTVTKSGPWLHQSGVLGGSPDGLLGTNGLVEAKCPWT